jgi:hypothetical protein
VVGCYDCLMNNLVLRLLAKLGLPCTVASLMGSLWDAVIHLVKTVYGTSIASFGSTQDQHFYGPGHGSTCDPLFWLLCYWLINLMQDPTIIVATFQSVCRSVLLEVTRSSFIDGTSLGVTSKSKQNLDISDRDNYLLEL